MRYRQYQLEDIESICKNYTEHGISNQLVIQATGLGKTVVMSMVPGIQSQLGLPGKVLVIVNRVELARQTKDKFERANPYLKVGIEQAENRADKDCHIVIVSVQTVGTAKFDENGDPIHTDRIKKLDPKEFSVIMVDETHRAPANTFRSTLMYFGVYPGKSNYRPWVLLLGFTATPNRSDNKGLEEFYSVAACNRNMIWGIESNWLADIKAYRVSTSVNLDDFDIKTTNTEQGRDFAKKELEKAVNIPARNKLIIERYKELCEGAKGIFFCVDVQHAKDLCQMANDMGVTGKCVFGATDKHERKQILKDHREGEFEAIFSVNALCLDKDTEILTRGGWKGIDTISSDDLVANWDNWKIFFEKPKNIFRRPTKPGERMVSIDSDTANMRLTPDHNVVHLDWKNRTKKNKAVDLIGKYIQVPAGGTATEEKHLKPIPENRNLKSNFKRRVSYNKHQIGRATGLKGEELEREVLRRMHERDSMRYKDPSELTEDECWLIGFWLGDGGVYDLSKGGREHRISQATCNQWAVEIIREKLTSVGIDFRETYHESKNESWSDHFQFSFSPGTGCGQQKVRGCYHLEPYLDKNGSDLLWALNQKQFDAMILGLWMSDGNHGQGEMKKSMSIYSANKRFIDTIQAIATCRGYQTKLSTNNRREINQNWNDISTLYLRKSDNPKFGVSAARQCNNLKQEEFSETEEVWCVKSTSGNIIARRGGKVFVTGNCEGYDDPSIGVICMCRPTQSKLFYEQAIGRGLRPFPSPEDIDKMLSRNETPAWIKPYCILIDFCDLSSKHNIVTVGSIFGVGSSFDFKGETVSKEAKKVREEISKLDERIQAEIENHINDIDSIEKLKSIVERIDLLRPPEISQEIAKISALEWLKINGKYEISLPGKDVIRIKENSLGDYTVQRSINGNTQDLKSFSDLERAVSWAERECVPEDSYGLLQAESKWKKERPSQKQIEYLFQIKKDLRQKFANDINLFTAWAKQTYTKGQLSSIINEHQAKRRQ